MTREPSSSGRGWIYQLTEKGQGLKAVCDAMGQWGAQWLEIEPHHLDPAYVLWATLKRVDVDALPDRPIIVRFDLKDRPGDSYWLVLRKPRPELCTRGSGDVEDMIARTDSACLVDTPFEANDIPAGTAQRPFVLGRSHARHGCLYVLDPPQPIRRRNAHPAGGGRGEAVRVRLSSGAFTSLTQTADSRSSLASVRSGVGKPSVKVSYTPRSSRSASSLAWLRQRRHRRSAARSCVILRATLPASSNARWNDCWRRRPWRQ